MKKPFITQTQLKDITKQYETPFHLYDEKGIRENARNLMQAFIWNKGFKEYFAVKATPNPEIMKILVEEGCGMDASSITELMLCKSINLKGDDIMFSSNVTPKEDFEYASKLDAIINLDDITHIDFLEKAVGIPEQISCRYNPGESFTFTTDIMSNPSEAKYGFTYEQLVKGLLNLKEKGAKTFGLHSFLASNSINSDYYVQLARLLFETAVKIKQKTGIKISFINLSGGIGVPYLPKDKKIDIFKVGELVKKEYYEILKPHEMDDIALFTELGRYMLAPYGHLVCTALHKKEIYKNYIGVDACAANLMRPAMYGSYHHISVMGKEDNLSDTKYDVTGGLCENNDKFAIDRMLPNIDVGDFIVIHDTGAHGHAMGYNYNGKLRSAELLLKEDNSVQLIRRAETADDYFATLDLDVI